MLTEPEVTEEETEEETEEPISSWDEELAKLSDVDDEEEEESVEEAKEPVEEELSASERLSQLKELDRENRELKNNLKDYDVLKTLPDMLKENPIGVLQDLGVNVDELLDQLYSYYDNGETEEAEDVYAKKIEELESRLNIKEQHEQEFVEQQQEQQAKAYISELVQANEERWAFVAHTPEILEDVLVAAEQDAQAGVDIDDNWVTSVLDNAEAILKERYSPMTTAPQKPKLKKTLGSHTVTDTPSGFAGLSYEETLERLSRRG